MGEPYAIAVLHDVIAKRKKEYQAIPSVLHHQLPPKSDLSYWMGFESSKYYPLGIVDEHGTAIARPEALVETLTWTSLDGVATSTSVTAHSTKNIYWFKALRIYVKGQLQVTFSAPDLPHLAPLVVDIAIEDKPNTSVASSSSLSQPAIEASAAPINASLPRVLPHASETSLDPYLHQILLDDRCRSDTALPSKAVSSHVSVVEHMKKVLAMRGHDRKTKKGHADRTTADTLLCLFDSIFASHLLYPHEKAPSSPHASHTVSALHLLRFAVLLRDMTHLQELPDEAEDSNNILLYKEFCDDLLKYLATLSLCEFF